MTDSPDESKIAEEPPVEMATPFGVAIYNVNPGEVTDQYHKALLSMIVYDMENRHQIISYRSRVGTSTLSMSRNAAVTHFLNETNAELFLFLDSDIECPADTLEILADRIDDEHQIVCGLYCSVLPEGLVPLMWHLPPADDPEATDGGVFTAEDYVALADSGAELVEVSRTGAGFLLVHRDVLLKMHANDPEDPWFGEMHVNGIKQGEDFTFFYRARHNCGYRVFVDISVNLHHIKTIALHKGMLGNVLVAPADES